MHAGWKAKDFWINYGAVVGTVLLAAAISYYWKSAEAFFFIWFPSYILVGALVSRFCTPSPLEQVNERHSEPLESIFDSHYRPLGVSESEFYEVWTEISRHLEVDPTKLRPADRFDIELSARGPGRGLDLEIIELNRWGRSELGRRGLPPPEANFESVDELVRYLLQASNP